GTGGTAARGGGGRLGRGGGAGGHEDFAVAGRGGPLGRGLLGRGRGSGRARLDGGDRLGRARRGTGLTRRAGGGPSPTAASQGRGRSRREHTRPAALGLQALAHRRVAGLPLLEHGQDGGGDEDRRVGAGEEADQQG